MKTSHGYLLKTPLLLCLGVAPIFGQTPGPSTNMVSGTQWPGGDPFLQRQNEPSMAVSSRNSLHLLAGANDYRSVDIPFNTPAETGDAWLGLFKSYDGGQTWTSTLLPGYPQDASTQGITSPVHGLGAAADPLVRAGTNGMMYYSGLAFNRTEGGLSKVFLSRYIDDNNLQGGDTIRYLGTDTVATGTATNFLDKPAIAVDIPRPGSQTCNIPASTTAPAQSFPGGRIYVAYTAFVGGEGSSVSSIMLTQSNDCGVTWAQPVKISGTQKTNQGASLAINPVTGDLYAVWRIFSTNTTTGGIGAVVEPFIPAPFDFGTFTSPAVQIATFAPFDQATTGLSFRTNDYPSIAIDGTGYIYVSWSERNLIPSGDSRVVLMSGKGRSSEFDFLNLLFPNLTTPAMIDPNPSQRGHQIMPALAFSSGKLTAAWYDFRDDDEVTTYTPIGSGQYTSQNMLNGTPLFGFYLQDPAPPYAATGRRQTVEVRAAQAKPAVPPVFNPSIIVSQFAFGTPSNIATGVVEQLEFDTPNLPMFEGGTVPFFGDYIDVAGPTFIPSGKTWRFNTQATDPDFTRVVWTDSRNVIQPSDGNWADYTPPAVFGGASVFNGTPRTNCDQGHTGDRNQDIFTAAITAGVVMSAKGNSKQLSSTLQREFPITVQNTTTQITYYRLSIAAQPPGGIASFLQSGVSITQLDITIPPQSSASRSVFVTSSAPTSSVSVSAQQITAIGGTLIPAGLASAVTLNGDVSNPNISNPNISNIEIYNPNISNPNISNPNISNPNISNPNISNPNISNLTIANPNISNPNISNPNISNPNISNPNISNPNISNPNISNPNISNTSLADVSYTVSNTGNTSASYSLQLLQSQAFPDQVVLQAIVSKVYTTPIASACALTVEAHYQPILNVTSPSFSTVTSLGSGAMNSGAPSFALDPGEMVLVTLRYYVPTSVTNFDPLGAVSPVVVSMASNTGTTTPPVTLTVSTAALLPTTASIAYSQQFQALGGTGTGYTWAAINPLPAGLNLSTSGLLQGAIATPGTYPITVQVTDSGANTSSKVFSLTVNPTPLITLLVLNPADQGITYSEQLVSSGGTPPVSWSLAAGSLPAGITLSPTGLLSGVPAVSGNVSPVIKITDAAGATASKTYTLAIGAPLMISTATLPPTEQGAGYSGVVSGAGGTSPYTWSIGSGTIPPGLTLNASGPTATLSGMPGISGIYNFTLKLTDALGETVSASYSITVIPPPSISAVTIPAETAGSPIPPVHLAANGGTAPYTWSGTLPNGLSLSPAGFISGTPAASGTFAFAVTATDNVGVSVTASFSETVAPQLLITSGPVAGFQNATYPATVLTATGGAMPYTFSGSLPAGMLLSTNSGVVTLAGFPTAAGSGTVTVTDANGGTASAKLTIIGSTNTVGSSTSPVTISGVSLLSQTGLVQATVLPGASVPLSFNYALSQGATDCPGCIDQITAGFVNTLPVSCEYNGIPGPGGASGSSGSISLTAPTTPGRYYIAFNKTQQYTCDISGALMYPITSADSNKVAVIDVIPASVTFLNVVLSNINITTPSVTAGSTNSVNATFNFSNPSSSGTIALGFNNGAAPLTCGGLSLSGTDSVTFDAPLQPGRYYLSVDNVNTCSGPEAWGHGVPGSNFAQFIGTVDVH